MQAQTEVELTMNGGASAAAAAGERRIILLDLFIAVLERKRSVAHVALWAVLLSALTVVLIPNHYKAEVVLAPPQVQLSVAAVMLGDLKTVASLHSPDLGLKDPNDIYLEMLASRSIADAVIGRFHLQQVYDKDTLTETREKLEKQRRFVSNTGGTLTITVEDKDAMRAAAMANYYAEQLRRLTRDVAKGDAEQRQVFYRQQLDFARKSRQKAETELARLQERTGLINVDEQAKALIANVSAVRAQIAGREVELHRLSAFATPNNPDVFRVRQEIEGLNEQARKLERTALGGEGNPITATKQLPQNAVEYLGKYREVRFYVDLEQLLQRQVEIAKIDEIALPVAIQTIDEGLPPEKKAWPKRGLIIVLCTFLAIVFSSLYYAMHHAGEQGMIDPEVHERLRRIAALMPGRRMRLKFFPGI